MNGIKEIDILDKSRLTLNSLFKGELTIFDKKASSNNENITDNVLIFNDISFSFIILKNPTIGKIVGLINTKAHSNKNNIFIFDYASEEIIAFCKEQNVFFVDTAGNCFINLPTLKVSIEGKKNLLNNLSETKIAFQKTGLKLIFQLLIQPNLAHQSFREISSITETSIASISKIFEELKEDGFMVEISRHKRKLSNIKRLITKWAISYAEMLRPKIHRGYFKAINIRLSVNTILMSPINKNQVYFGGEHGIYFFNQAIKPQQHLVLYTNSRLSSLAASYNIFPFPKSKNKDEKIEIIEIFWKQKMPEEWTIDNKRIVPLLLIYADLINSTNYRSVKAAEDLLDNEIRTRFVRDNFQW